MKAKELKKKYIDFFKEKGHGVVESGPLIPENDPTVLFTTAGMHPLVPFLMGQKHPLGKRLVSVQKCMRTQDIDEVGDEIHTTFFEMLGNWSLGDYFKKEAITWSYEFLTDKKWLGLDPKRLSFSCFAGDKDAPRDEEAAKHWINCGVPKERIAYLQKKDNWWGPAGQTGPCGPDTEMFYWTPNDVPAPKKFDPQDKRWVEIWNDVFMQYNKTKEGTYEPLQQKNVDTGLGVERVAMIMQGKQTVFDTELFQPIFKKISELSSTKSQEHIKAYRIIADHMRASTFILGDEIDIVPSNVDQGYILRRYIRRVIRYGRTLGMKENFTAQIAEAIIDLYHDDYPLLMKKKKFVLEELKKEEEKFMKTIEKGLKEFQKLVGKHLTGKDAFLLFQSYGFPLEMTEELAKEKGISIDTSEFESAFKKHQELSRQSTEGKFKGGLMDHSEETVRLHTATHMLHAALRKVLGHSVSQKGSNITKERLRFDFSFDRKMTPEEVKKVEEIVNENIKRSLPVSREEMTLAEAKKKGALAFFGEKYGDKVSVYTIGDYSKEVCGGPHVKNTKELGHFKILKEEAVSSGVRRIKAVVSNG